MEELEGCVAVVTGAASGIGLATAEAFAAEGMRVVMADIDADALGPAADRVRSGGASVETVIADVSDPEAVDRIGVAAIDAFGSLNVAVNNAGIVNRGYSWELPLEEWHRVMDVNLWGVIHGVRTFVPLILAAGSEGHIVNVASMASVRPVDRLGPYTVAKHGILGLSDVLRAEFEAIGAPVGVSIVMPGLIKTGMNPIGTVEPSTVAANIVDAVRRRRSYVFTDDHHTDDVDARLQAIIAARGDVIS